MGACRNVFIIVSGTSGSLEEAEGVQTLFKGICLLDLRVVSSYISDSPGLLLLVSLGAEHPGPWAAEVSPSGLVFTCGSGENLRDDTSGSSALWGGEICGGVSLSIISGRRSPEEENC